MRITISPTIHDSACINGEDERGEKDWPTFNSASVEFDPEHYNTFEMFYKTLTGLGWPEKWRDDALEEWIESRV